MKKISIILTILFLVSACGSKKKLQQSENLLMAAESRLSKAEDEKKECIEEKEELQATVESYYNKIQDLQKDNGNKVSFNSEGLVVSEESKRNMRRTLQNVDQEKLSNAKTFNDSVNLAVAHNIKQSLMEGFSADEDDANTLNNFDDLEVSVNHPVVKITINNSILFASGSSWVTSRSFPLVEKLSQIIKSEPNMEVLVEGHADVTPVVEGSYLEDNWLMAGRRAISVVRLMETRYAVNGEQLIASSRSSYKPVGDNATEEGRAKNRRTTITLMPNMDKFMQLMN